MQVPPSVVLLHGQESVFEAMSGRAGWSAQQNSTLASRWNGVAGRGLNHGQFRPHALLRVLNQPQKTRYCAIPFEPAAP